jgi:tRNA (adenine57-N1/adenine58-N1)-methyltransferase catalytic subunit
MSEIFAAGDKVQLTGPKGKMNSFTLEKGGRFGTHRGDIRHDEIIGKASGSVFSLPTGEQFLALKPLLSDYVLSMPRGAQIIYPKDAGQIIVEGDIFPGATVIEAGVGSGALSSYLLRAIGDKGKLYSFELRSEFAEIAQANVENFLSFKPKNWKITIGALQEQLGKTLKPRSADRAVLDMLAPWQCIEAVAEALKPGGLIVVYVATASQLSRVAEQLKDSEKFTGPVAFETLVRPWHLEGLAVRPEHRMISHTGFLLTARKLADGAQLPDFRKRRVNKVEGSEEDTEQWFGLSERKVGEKKLRKTLRQVTNESAKRKK